MKHIYLINNGGSYSEYGIRGILESDLPVDWTIIHSRLIADVNAAPVDDDKWYWDDDEVLDLLIKHGTEYGLRLVEHTEIEADARYNFGAGDGVESWDFEIK